MHTLRPGRRAERPASTPGATTGANPWLWLVGGMVLFFLVPLLGTDLLGLQADTYYLIYFTIAVAWFAVFVARPCCRAAGPWRQNLGVSLAVGAVAGAGSWPWSSARRAPGTRTGGGSGSRSSGVA